MTIATRLRKLEHNNPNITANSQANERLLAFLETTYERLDTSAAIATDFSKQSVSTVLTIALFGPLPLTAELKQKVVEIAEQDTNSGRLAKSILKVVV